MFVADTVELQACLDRLNTGDAAGRDLLLEYARERLQRLTRKMLGDFARVRRYEETDDVLQNSLVRLVRRLAAVRVATVAEFFRLAAGEIRRELIDLARHYYGPLGAGKNEAPLPEPTNNSDGGHLFDPSEHTADPGRLALWTDFHAAVERLPPEERDVFSLVWYHELTQEQAAGLLGVSVPTVKRRWLTARLALKRFLDPAPAGK
jgi:RNA polymerase sigma-70 factor (ECF subfamily)